MEARGYQRPNPALAAAVRLAIVDGGGAAALAKLVGARPRQVRRIADGRPEIPETIDAIARILELSLKRATGGR